MPRPELTPRRQQLLLAAMEVVAENGLRGLTHRAVDRKAGLPEGSCSGYLRTRSALQGALASFVAARLEDDVRRLADEIAHHGEDLAKAQAMTQSLFQQWLGAPALLVTKLELAMEGSRDQELASIFATSRRELVEVVEETMALAGREHSDERAEALVAALDGVLLGALQRPAEDQSAYLADCLTHLMGQLLADRRGAH
ncbi:DNA-binding transcriptional regulator YbjK [Nocardioides daedukensis]|uniref:DNA-binding transcriptional regulator YbjK n=1 Tax=Nocardioides daedukensis TaxID=634462 RepID=A0A7Y9S231_9ACTN|nr:DNA-binding transcriptional regulator YbjK [Nocardioides daedukensis]